MRRRSRFTQASLDWEACCARPEALEPAPAPPESEPARPEALQSAPASHDSEPETYQPSDEDLPAEFFGPEKKPEPEAAAMPGPADATESSKQGEQPASQPATPAPSEPMRGRWDF
jgi:hypothetical protein